MPRTTAKAIPATMLAAAIDRYGPASVLKVRELETPEPEPHQILIQIHTAGIGIWDAEMRSGSWKPPGRPKFPRVLGLDGSGTIAAKGARVKRFHIGDRVWASRRPTFGAGKRCWCSEPRVLLARWRCSSRRRVGHA